MYMYMFMYSNIEMDRSTDGCIDTWRCVKRKDASSMVTAAAIANTSVPRRLVL